MRPPETAPQWMKDMAELLDRTRIEAMSPGWNLFRELCADWLGHTPFDVDAELEARERVIDALDAWIRDEPGVAWPFLALLEEYALWPLPPVSANPSSVSALYDVSVWP